VKSFLRPTVWKRAPAPLRQSKAASPHLPIAPNSCHDLDVKIPTLLAVLLALALSAFGADCPTNQPKTEAALIELENNWAAALSRKDADAVACMVADEFEDADVDGSLHTRRQMLEHIPRRKPGRNQLSEMRAHVEGNSAFVRGLNTVVEPSGKAVAHVRFTDVFTFRDGRWQALAGHETLLGEGIR
jgi:ketosteroid isomerase-like protein